MFKKILLSIILISYLLPSLYAQDSAPQLILRDDGLFYYEDSENKKISRKKFTFAEAFSEGLAVVEENLKFGCINTNGKVVIPIRYDDLGGFYEGLSYASNGDKYGYINKEGKAKIKFMLTHAENFDNGLAKVGVKNPKPYIYGKQDNVYGLIKKNGDLLAAKWFSTVEKESDSIYTVTIDGDKYTLSHIGELNVDTRTKFHRRRENDKMRYIETEVKPEFKGGQTELLKYIEETLIYPQSAEENSIYGRVFTQFTINKKGEVIDVRIAKGAHPLLDKEALRVIKSMPDWSPGMYKGELVMVNYIIPISFK